MSSFQLLLFLASGCGWGLGLRRGLGGRGEFANAKALMVLS
jgi:hypothetical protein